ncbi:Asparagine--tRNA ligase, cytoplasmic 1 [Acorus gramineus]|uniref:asparagine--tRNA ligase n=1 Tax=Acorus gramineus TaxID=55184 RepID=A0AAV9BN49_ACOGR|nr:Asparagine--tRNA ligase, cytoplasmic 1 [Acorus gramineus]
METQPPPVEEMSAVTLTSDGPPSPSGPRRTLIRSIVARPDGGLGLVGSKVTVGGMVKTGREQGKGSFAFLELNDGSYLDSLQVIVDSSVADLGRLVPTGTSVLVEGELKKTPDGTKQPVELRVQRVLDVGSVDPSKYPIPKTKLTLEFLRDFVHLRARTNTFNGSCQSPSSVLLSQISAVTRIRDELAFATHTFFRENGFRYVHTPIITTSDCEGAGEMFQVTAMFSDAEKLEKELKENPPPSEDEIEAAKLLVKEKGEAVSHLKSIKASKADIGASVSLLTSAKENLARLEERFKLKAGIAQKDGKIDYSRDFFGRQAFLTVSGQLQVETYACALGNVYTFGPTFRAEHSHTSRHLAEFWMIEPEIAFADLQEDMYYAESYVRFLCQWLLDHCFRDMEFMVKNYDKTAIDRLRLVASTPFKRISYTEAIKLLESVTDKKFENKVQWGIDLASEHERYLTEVVFKKPVIVYNYPKGIKAFYMRLNDDDKTVAAMDVLVPKVGELIGGSQREERYDILVRRIQEAELPLEPYEWYLDLRRYGTLKHSGFGLGFERMILFATGLDNIRDVIPFPRYPGRADL